MGPEKEVRIQNLSPTDPRHPELTTAERVPSRPGEGLAPCLLRGRLPFLTGFSVIPEVTDRWQYIHVTVTVPVLNR